MCFCFLKEKGGSTHLHNFKIALVLRPVASWAKRSDNAVLGLPRYNWAACGRKSFVILFGYNRTYKATHTLILNLGMKYYITDLWDTHQ